MDYFAVMIILSATLTGVIVRATPGPYEVDIQADYLNILLGSAKLRPTVNGELNFSPHEKVFSNVVRSIAGERVAEHEEVYFQMNLPPKRDSETLIELSVVIHSSTAGAISHGQVLQIVMTCDNSTTFQAVKSYSFTELDEDKEWLEMIINITEIFLPASYECSFFTYITGNVSSLDTILVLYDYCLYGGLNIHVLKNRVQKRNALVAVNKTLLSDYQASGANCSVQSVFLTYADDIPLNLFDEAAFVISPNNVGINMTFCYGSCDSLFFTPPSNLTSATRHHLISRLLRDENTHIPGASCIPETIEYDTMLIMDRYGLISMLTFPQVTTCKCIV